jgi:hypothetical protein
LADCGTSGGLFSSAITSRALHPDRRIALAALVPDQSAELCLKALTVLMLCVQLLRTDSQRCNTRFAPLSINRADKVKRVCACVSNGSQT